MIIDASKFSRIRRFSADKSGGASVQAALMFGSIGLALSLLAAPLLAQAVATMGDRGVDGMTTGSIGGASRYTVRRSVLDGSPQTLCAGPISARCRDWR